MATWRPSTDKLCDIHVNWDQRLHYFVSNIPLDPYFLEHMCTNNTMIDLESSISYTGYTFGENYKIIILDLAQLEKNE